MAQHRTPVTHHRTATIRERTSSGDSALDIGCAMPIATSTDQAFGGYNFLKISAPFVPPKPNEFESAQWIFIARA